MVVFEMSGCVSLISQKSEIFDSARAPFVRFADIFPADGEIAPRGSLLFGHNAEKTAIGL